MSAIGLDETWWALGHVTSMTATLGSVTTVADVENHQIIDIRSLQEVHRRGWPDRRPARGYFLEGADSMIWWPSTCRPRYVTTSGVGHAAGPKANEVVEPFQRIALASRCLDAVRRQEGRPNRPGTGVAETYAPLPGPLGPYSWARRSSMPRPPTDWTVALLAN